MALRTREALKTLLKHITMFLDDELYNKTVNHEIESGEALGKLIHQLYKICEDRLRDTLTLQMSYKDVTRTFDRIFNSWDLFIKRLDKEDYIFTDIIKDFPFRDTILKNKEIDRIYKRGK